MHVDPGDGRELAVSVGGHTAVVAGLLPPDAVVEEEDVVRGHDLVVVLPDVVGLGVGLSGAEGLVRGRALLQGDQRVRYLNVLGLICGKVRGWSRYFRIRSRPCDSPKVLL